MKNHDFYEYLSEILKKHKELKNFLDEVNKNGEIYILGGSLRDSFYKTKDEYKIRDLDLIFSEDISKIKEILSKYIYYENRFGGYKLIINGLDIDIWSYKDNWATKNNFTSKERKLLENISSGTFLNIDSVVYNYETREINKLYFQKVLKRKRIEFVTKNRKYIQTNPDKPLNIFRIIYSCSNYKLNLSLEVIKYIQEYIDTHTNYLSIIYASQLKHYKCEKMSISSLYLEIKKVTSKKKYK